MLNRRHFLQKAAALSAAGLSSSLLSQQAMAGDLRGERILRAYNIHTGEMVSATFWANGHYIDEEVQALDFLVRDHRANMAVAMQRQLYQNLYQLQELFDSRQPLYVISGYRAPETNAGLRKVSNGVAQRSLHTLGQAMDIRIPGVSHRNLHEAALALGSGGVGYYPKSGFVHIDTGRVRHWTA